MTDKWLYRQTDNGWIQLFRYFFVGGVAFAVDFGLLWLLTEWCGLHYMLSATLSFIAGLAVNYTISVLWIFGKHTLRNRIAEFIIYGIIGVVGLGLNAAIIWLLTESLNVHYLFSKIFSAAIVFVWNFTARRYLLFRNGKNDR